MILTDISLLQPHQRLHRRPPRILIKHLQITLALHRPIWPPQLYRNNHKPYQPEHKENKRSHHDNGGQQASLEDEVDHGPDEGNGEGSDGDVV